MFRKGITILLILIVSLCVFTACNETKIIDQTIYIGVYVVTFDTVYDEAGTIYTYDVYVQLNPDGTYYFEQTCKDPSMTKFNMSFDGEWGFYSLSTGTWTSTSCVWLKTAFFPYDEEGIKIEIDEDKNLVYRYIAKYLEKNPEKYTMKKIQ